MRRKNSTLDFIAAFNQAFDTTSRVGKELELAKAAQEKPEEITVDQPGAYGPMPEGQDFPSQTGTKFMGQVSATPMNEQQISEARQMAMAGIHEKYGDSDAANRIRSGVTNNKLANMQIKAAESQERQTKRAEDLQGKADAVNQEVADYTSQFGKNPDGTERQLTYDDHLHLGQYKAARLMSAGLVEDASKLASQNMQFTANKIQVETAERDKALGLAAAAAATGDLSGFKTFYNKYIPDGAQTTDIVAQKDGKIVVSRVGVDGEPMAPHTFKDVNELIAGAQSINKPEALYNYANNEFHRSMQQKQLALQKQQVGISGAQLKLQQDAKEREVKKEKDIQAAGVGLYSQNNPGATNATIEAVRTGIIPAAQGKGAYKVEANDVTTLLGRPAVNVQGNPILNPLTGGQAVNRNPDREAEFFQFMQDNGITDSNAGLAKFLAMKKDDPVKATTEDEAKKLRPGQTFIAPNGGVYKMK